MVGSLIFPLGIAVFTLPRVLKLPLSPYIYNTIFVVSFLLCVFGIPTGISTVICGHRALRLSNHLPERALLRSKVILLRGSLVLGYLDIFASIVLVVLVAWLLSRTLVDLLTPSF